jgi:hypothetical protein
LDDPKYILEEIGVFCDAKEQAADCSAAGMERMFKDVEDRAAQDPTCKVLAWHCKFDNKASEWKSQYTLEDHREQFTRKRQFASTIGWGEPCRGKCGADGSGARFGKRVKRTRRDPTMPTPETALEIEKFSEEMQHQFLSIGKKNNKYEADRKIKRSAMLAITTDDLEAARVWRRRSIAQIE